MNANTPIEINERSDNNLRAIGYRKIFGLDVAVMTRKEAAALLEANAREGISVRLAFLNTNLANITYEDKDLRKILHGFVLLNDGSGINLASRLLYRQPFPDNLNGTDFTPYFLDHCGIPLRIFLLGASPTVVARVATIFSVRWPQHLMVGYQHGFFSKAKEGEVVDKIRIARPNLVLVAMGNGLQERLVEKLVPEVTLSAWGVGALFDFLCGDVRRAPSWMRLFGIEWLYRLLQEPVRMWRRYLLGNPKFIFRVLRELRRMSVQDR